MNLTLANFQITAIGNLMDAMASDKRDIVLKSPTGSGKTIILTRFIELGLLLIRLINSCRVRILVTVPSFTIQQYCSAFLLPLYQKSKEQ